MATQKPKEEPKEPKYDGVFYIDAAGNKVDPNGKIIEAKK